MMNQIERRKYIPLQYISCILLYIAYEAVYQYFDRTIKSQGLQITGGTIQQKVWGSYVAEVVFPIVFGYFLDEFGRRICLAMLTITIIIPGFVITQIALSGLCMLKQAQYYEPSQIGLLFLVAGIQSSHVIIITTLYAWTGEIYIYMLAHSLFQGIVKLIEQTNDYKESTYFTIIMIFGLLMSFCMWMMEKTQLKVVKEGRPYLLNVYFIFVIIQSFNFCVGDTIIENTLMSNDNRSQFQQQIIKLIHIKPLVVVLICYLTTFLVVLILFFVKRITIMTQTFVADVTMSFALLLLLMIVFPESSKYSPDTIQLLETIVCLALVLITVSSSMFCITSLLIALKSVERKGIAVGALIGVSRYVKIQIMYHLDKIFWIGTIALIVQKICYFVLGFYDTNRLKIMFKTGKEKDQREEDKLVEEEDVRQIN